MGVLEKFIATMKANAPAAKDLAMRGGGELLEAGKTLGGIGAIGGKRFARRHPELTAAGVGGAGALGLAELLGSDEEDEAEQLRLRLAMLEQGY